jgi:hypothetical protein
MEFSLDKNMIPCPFNSFFNQNNILGKSDDSIDDKTQSKGYLL